MDDSPPEKRFKQNCQQNESPISDGVYLNKIPDIHNDKKINSIHLKDIINNVHPQKSVFFTFYVRESFFDEIYGNYKIGLNNITLIIGVGRDIIKTVKEQKYENDNIKRRYVPMEPYASHHTKLSLFFENDGKPHVVVGTANLNSDEWDNITQALYYAKGQEKLQDYEYEKDFFLTDIVHYLESGYKNQIFYDEDIIPLINDLKKWSFIHIKDRIIFSICGMKIPKVMNSFGMNKIRLLLEECKDKLRQISYFVVQCSSIGFIGPSEKKWLVDGFLKNLTNGQLNSLDKLKIIYPSLDDVRNSINGYESGYLFPYTKRNKEKQGKYINPCLHRWKSETLNRTRYLPHIKTYTAFDHSDKPIYQFIGSHNLSKAAWGEMDAYGTFVMKNYEVGFFTFDEKSMIIPYDLPLVKYQSDQQIWTINESHMELDCNGYVYDINNEILYNTY
ncbi:Tyrosyl-DNA phosphodiesterase 1 [Strongyloides ratti]|uniref:Tyrosyl-DNA phosphodiesterase 1 n=1 Tax=Strongyloides ratti TaxID=34506 RepID=A0A090LIP2_STRRB|nr:Tyrosyl-DNA phosphodiesterase 1 [Strongyloides ratti]CEF67365.1 Tyrosyl-DNA phosphodiesterase 1 [Strongyloides ratti]